MNKPSISTFRFKLFVCAIAVASLASVTHAFAQSNGLQVKVPFSFENGSQHFPAGVYQIQYVSSQLLLFRGASTSGFVMTNSAQSPNAADHGKVKFQRYGNRYFLREVWVAGSNIGRECVRTREEKQVQIAQKAATPNVELTLNTLHQ